MPDAKSSGRAVEGLGELLVRGSLGSELEELPVFVGILGLLGVVEKTCAVSPDLDGSGGAAGELGGDLPVGEAVVEALAEDVVFVGGPGIVRKGAISAHRGGGQRRNSATVGEAGPRAETTGGVASSRGGADCRFNRPLGRSGQLV